MLKKLNNDSLITWCFALIASVYFYAEDYSNALQYSIKTKTYPAEYNKNKQLHTGLIGESYFHLNQFDSALFYIKQSYNLTKSGGHWSVPYLYMGKLYEKKGLLTQALSFYHESIPEGVATTDSIKSCLAIANLFNHTNVMDSAFYYARLAFAVAQNTSSYLYIINASSLLKDFYKRKKQTDSAFKYQEIMLAANDSLFNREKLTQMQNLTFNEDLRHQEIVKEREKFQNEIKIYGLAAGLVVLLLLAGILWRNNRLKQKAKTKIEKAYSELKSTQTQLIRSEKMASLGELTAGIAHEIQNPLNFVNNFSDVNTELIDEAEQEMDKGNINEAKTILIDIKENEQKINHHGKRADAIVKNMLQPSRTSSGVKEPTDINALTNEYLRLTSHGLRAKDKSFNAIIRTDFDETMGKINIIPQDIGRVLLNLYNNAFYAVSEKKKQQGEGYEPTVSVSTKRINDKVEIRVKDNGNGIPQKVLNKIFQPFFTTKPTGQGTGLGLSLSYDIIKAHNGEINVETKEEEFAEFVILLPYQ